MYGLDSGFRRRDEFEEPSLLVIPAKAGIQSFREEFENDSTTLTHTLSRRREGRIDYFHRLRVTNRHIKFVWSLEFGDWNFGEDAERKQAQYPVW